MGILDGVKRGVKRIMGDEKQLADDRDQAKLEQWKNKLTEAMSEHDTFRGNAATWDAIYNGTKAVGANVGRVYVSDRYNFDDITNLPGTKDARQVVNLTFQLIESQIDISVPMPSVDAIEGDDDNERKDMIEGMLTYMAEGPELERINSENERIAKKNSMAIMKVSYNPDFKRHKFRGRIETTNPHPVNVIPQPGVYRVKDMDYLFHIETRTIDYVCRRYGDEFRDKLQDESAEYSYLEEFSTTPSYTNNSADRGKVSVVECWYKDKEGDVCLLTWANDVILKDMPKFFYKRDPEGNILEYEEMEIEQYDEEGNYIGSQTVTIPAYVPKHFPFVIQYNIPKEKSYYGKADPDIIYDQQEAIKKVLSIEEEKLIRGTTKIFARKGTGIAQRLTDAVSQIIEVDDPLADIRVVDLKTPDRSLKDYYELMKQAAKDSLGVTEASQGRSEGSSLSGRALEILANNTAGRISVKIFEKQIAFTELYQLYYDFLLAFIDDTIPYRVPGENNKPQFGYFDKSRLLKQDDAGEWYWPDFDIKISSDTGLPKDKRFIMDSANQSAGKMLDPIAYWMVMKSIGFPNASAILEREQQKEEMAQQQAQQQPPGAQIPPEGPMPLGGGMPPELQQAVAQLPPEVQQVLSQLPPEQVMQFLSMPVEQQMAILQGQQF